MQPIYIVMICAAALFTILLIAYILQADYAKKINMQKEESLEKTYSDKNLAKMEYDVAMYDEETRKLLNPQSDSQVTMDEVIEKDDGKDEDKPSAEEILFGKVDDEGMEEITGNFKGD